MAAWQEARGKTTPCDRRSYFLVYAMHASFLLDVIYVIFCHCTLFLLFADSPGAFGSPRYGIHLSRTGYNRPMEVVATNEEHKPLLGKYLLWCDTIEGLQVEEQDWFARRDLDGTLFGDYLQRVKTQSMFLLARKWGICMPQSSAKRVNYQTNEWLYDLAAAYAHVTNTTASITTNSNTINTTTINTSTMNTTSPNGTTSNTTSTNSTSINTTSVDAASATAGTASFTTSSKDERMEQSFSEEEGRTVAEAEVDVRMGEQTAAVDKDKDNVIRRQAEEIRRYYTVTN